MADTGNNKIAAPVAHANIYEALCAAQASFGDILRTTKGARGMYAPLDAVLGAILPKLNQHGIILSQPTKIVDGEIVLETRLVHMTSGDCITCEYPVAQSGGQHQQIGASLTYARRYSLLALCGVAPADEADADKDESAPTARKAPAPQQKVTPPAEMKKPATLDERMSACRTYLSQAKDADDLIVRWESPKAEALRAELQSNAPDKLATLTDYYGQVLSRFEGAFA